MSVIVEHGWKVYKELDKFFYDLATYEFQRGKIGTGEKGCRLLAELRNALSRCRKLEQDMEKAEENKAELEMKLSTWVNRAKKTGTYDGREKEPTE